VLPWDQHPERTIKYKSYPKKESKVTTYLEVAQAIVSAGYLSDADAQAAANILADALVVEVAEQAEADAILDEQDQEDLREQAEDWAA
jgi:hypothetical protein